MKYTVFFDQRNRTNFQVKADNEEEAQDLYEALKGIERLMETGFDVFEEFEKASEAPFKKLHEALARWEDK